MKLPAAKTIVRYFLLGLLGLVIVFLVCRTMIRLDDVAKSFASLIQALQAVLIGLVMTYLLYPIAHFTEHLFTSHSMSERIARRLSTAIAVFALLLVITVVVYGVLPQVMTSLPPLLRSLPYMISQFTDSVTAFLVAHGQDPSIINDASKKLTEWYREFVSADNLSTIVNLAGQVMSVAKTAFNFIVGIIVMVYVLLSRDQFLGQGKKFLYAVCPDRFRCNRILRHLRVINHIFSGFVSGKMLDSFIIGCICGAVLTILNIPYALVISMVIGITNIIPVFGPFIGGVPCAFLLLLTEPRYCLVFSIFIIILQQVDGNIIGPRILGDSTGLPAFWVLFSLLLFNHLMGFLGMLLGVPLFASFYYLLRELVNSLLRKKGLPSNTDDYVDVGAIDDEGNFLQETDVSLAEALPSMVRQTPRKVFYTLFTKRKPLYPVDREDIPEENKEETDARP